MSGPTAAVYLDGVRLADTAASFENGDTTVLTDLTLDWGRKTVVDQPGVDACNLTVAQRGGSAEFLQRLRTGRRIEIRATADVRTDATGPTFPDPGFEDAPPGSAPPGLYTNVTGRVTDLKAATGDQSLRLEAIAPALDVAVQLPPAPFSPSPTAWDHVPATTEGQQWRVGATIKAHPDALVTIQALIFRNPQDQHPEVIASVTHFATADWETYEIAAAAPASGQWVGFGLVISRIGPAWVEMPGPWAGTPGSWGDYASAFLDDLVVGSDDAQQLRTVLAFQGRVTDQEGRWDRRLAGGSLLVDVIARSSPSADLQNANIGDEPWPVQTIRERITRILQLAGSPVTAQIDPSLADTLVTYRDVDSQPAGGLISELAASVDGVAWSAVHQTTGAYYWIEDPSRRPSLLRLGVDPDTGLVTVKDTDQVANAIQLESRQFLEDPLRWVQSVEDVFTRIDLVWMEQTLNDEGRPDPTERHILLVDPALEADLGQRRLYLGTQLQSAADGLAVAGRVLARTGDRSWRVRDAEWRPELDENATSSDTIAALDLLDGTTRLGHPLLIRHMPSWSPAGSNLAAYVEGGKYVFHRGAWRLSLTLSPPGAAGASITWTQTDPAWRWADFDPAVTWSDLFGVGPTFIGEPR